MPLPYSRGIDFIAHMYCCSVRHLLMSYPMVETHSTHAFIWKHVSQKESVSKFNNN